MEEEEEDVHRCPDCAPVQPAVRLDHGTNKFCEDTKEASLYEQLLKQRPDPLVMKL